MEGTALARPNAVERGHLGGVTVCLDRVTHRVRRATGGVAEASGAGDREVAGESEKLEMESCEDGERGAAAAAAVLRLRALRVQREWVGDEPLPAVEEE